MLVEYDIDVAFSCFLGRGGGGRRDGEFGRGSNVNIEELFVYFLKIEKEKVFFYNLEIY